MKDFLENMEDAALRQYEDMEIPGKPGFLRCYCGRMFDENKGTVLSPNPYEMPGCPKCAEEWFKKHNINRKE